MITTSSGKHLEYINHAHLVCLMYKLKTTARNTDDLSIGFDRSCDRRQRELTNNKIQKVKFHLRIYLKHVFDFPEHQETGTFGLGYKLTLTRKIDNSVLNEGKATNNGKFKINAKEWYVPLYTPSLEEYNQLMNQILKIQKDLFS